MTENPNMPTLTGVVPAPPERRCPYEANHGNPFRYCACGWVEDQEPHDCSIDGHEYQHAVDNEGELLLVYCGCGASWSVDPQ